MRDFMKWCIEKKHMLSDRENELNWNKIHQNNYNMWSMTEDAKIKDKILNEIINIPHKNILIPGCGSVVGLQNYLCDNLESIDEIVCTDYASVITIAKSKKNHGKIIYECKDSKNLGYYDRFDIVINVNSIVSYSDMENRDILRSCYEAMKNGASFIGFFPTIFCKIEIACLENKYNKLKKLTRKELKKSIYDIFSLYEDYQIFYTPLVLRCILKESKYVIEKFELFFCDTKNFIEQAEKYYEIFDKDILVYEFYVNAKKVDNIL
jgi:hypothetical protein